ncbi:IS607 family element transposase accessory protein TnpB [Nonomuraea glycinis]|uniref:Transposase n=1 Tax=Nonomuraea glycinis TaxID=2047744 RepID=A0A918A7A5_9ACTN|nr:IS607 family element RNA-guided endonuclease TnpB [Nonomuraea glycinis]MCA2179192.1 IS607 family element transposase accessory protein TnpB [Nonomuraea glycinis]GGP10191.1 putative transposase [Nonomuraea glycinis]
MRVVQAYRFALDPTARQAAVLASHCGAVRVAFNWGLAQVKANLAQREAERSYGIADDLLTPALSWSMYSLRKRWNQVKDEVAPWWAGNSKEAYACGLARLADALANWRDSRQGTRKGPKVGFPRFKAKRRAARSVRFTTGTIRLDGHTHVVLPVLGRLKTHEPVGKLARLLAGGGARIASATVRWQEGRWHVSFTVHTERAVAAPARPDAVIGVDLGINTLAVFSDGRPPVANPRHLDAAARRLRRLSRAVSRKRGPDRRTRQRPSKRWLRANAARNRAEYRVAALRRDGIHRLTTGLARTYGTIVVEDLHVAGMIRNRRLARAISDAGFGEIRRQLAYKTGWNGGRLIVASRWFPSSKTCSSCQAVKAKLPLRMRAYVCEGCGLTLDRDVNAALNLASLVERTVAGSGPETENGRGADRKTPPGGAGGREASTPHRTLTARIRRGPSPTTGESLRILETQ